MGKLQDRVAVITGGTRGIGRGIAEAFLAEGARVVVSGRSADKGQQALDEMKAGDRAHFIACDVKDRGRRRAAHRGHRPTHFGSVDILVNNAGGSDGFALVHELADEAWHERHGLEPQLDVLGDASRASAHGVQRVGPRHLHLVGRGQAGEQGDGQPLHHGQARA